MNKTTEQLLSLINEEKIDGKTAYNIREDAGCAGRMSTDNIKIESKEGADGIVVNVAPGTVGEKAFIPACITRAGINEVVYNDFFIGDNSDVEIIAGCGVHSNGEEDSEHNGIHRFFVGKNSKVIYRERHIATGVSFGEKRINPVTECYLEDGSVLTMDTVQLSGVDSSIRKTKAVLNGASKIVVRERILTEEKQNAETYFEVTLNGEGSGADLVSRSVAKGESTQSFTSKMIGNNICTGHSECDAIISDTAHVLALPALEAHNVDAQLIHEAAIGKIAGEQLLKLMTLGLTQEEAEQRIIDGFLK